jgi:hypothetical protein
VQFARRAALEDLWMAAAVIFPDFVYAMGSLAIEVDAWFNSNLVCTGSVKQ